MLEYILQPDMYPELYRDLYHKVRINYYPPRRDNKEGWDNIDIFGWLGYEMQIKVDFLCRDSILAAPLVLDLALFLDLASRAGLRGIQEWLSFFFKSPMSPPGVYPEHDLFIQRKKLTNTLRYLMGKRSSATSGNTLWKPGRRPTDPLIHADFEEPVRRLRNCVAVCPVSAISIGDDGRAVVNSDQCVECYTCYRGLSTERLNPTLIRTVRRVLGWMRLRFDPEPDICPTSAIEPQELTWPRVVRRAFSDPLVPTKLPVSTAGARRK